jgi:hypothetical protein
VVLQAEPADIVVGTVRAGFDRLAGSCVAKVTAFADGSGNEG